VINRRKRRKRIGLLLVLICLSLARCEEEHQRPANIYVPDGYVGWLRIEYGVAGKPELKTDFIGPWEYQWFPASGLLQTSSPLRDGAATANYFYYSGNQTRPLPYDMVNGGIISWCVRKPDGSRLERNFVTFFVGPKEEYEKHKHELERFKRDDCRYVLNSLDDLPKVQNLAAKS
jgi:hypothetical protein